MRHCSCNPASNRGWWRDRCGRRPCVGSIRIAGIRHSRRLTDGLHLEVSHAHNTEYRRARIFGANGVTTSPPVLVNRHQAATIAGAHRHTTSMFSSTCRCPSWATGIPRILSGAPPNLSAGWLPTVRQRLSEDSRVPAQVQFRAVFTFRPCR
jgi:hypothetical protein